MLFIISKFFITSFIIVFVSEIVKYNNKIGALISSIPIITTLVLIWMYLGNEPIEKIANHSYYTFWYVLPTLPIFLILSYLLSHQYSFFISLIISLLIGIICFCILIYIGKLLGIDLYL